MAYNRIRSLVIGADIEMFPVVFNNFEKFAYAKLTPHVFPREAAISFMFVPETDQTPVIIAYTVAIILA